MKKILFVALAAATMMSCTENEVIENAGNKKVVKFGTAVSSTTRAAITDITALQASGFTVYAYNTGKDIAGTGLLNKVFMDNLAVSYSAPDWSFTGTYYWPLSDNIQFFAYAKDADATYNVAADATYPTIDYTIAADPAQQKDFVVAEAVNQTSSDNTVSLKFNHVLTQVNFSVKGDDENLTYKIASLKIEGVANTGTYSYGTDKWTATGTAGTYTYPIATGASVTGTTAVKLDQDNGALMLMPQTLTAAAKINITYSVYNGNDPVAAEITAPVTLSNTTAWEPGKKIRYTLTLANNAAKVSFKPEVGNWSDEQSGTVETPAK